MANQQKLEAAMTDHVESRGTFHAQIRTLVVENIDSLSHTVRTCDLVKVSPRVEPICTLFLSETPISRCPIRFVCRWRDAVPMWKSWKYS